MQKNITQIFLAIILTMSVMVYAQAEESVTLITNVNIFDGENEQLLEGYDVLVVKNLIEKIDKDINIAKSYEIDVKTGGYKAMSGGYLTDLSTVGDHTAIMVYEPEKNVKKEVMVNVIDGGGRTLIPGLIDVHWHISYAAVPASILLAGDMSEMAIIGFLEAEKTLLRGFTTVRDMGGNPFAIKKLTDTGQHPGPRIFASGPPISQTSGHFDYHMKNDHPKNMTDPLNYWERNSVIMTADGVPEVMLRVRENLRMGATQIKIAAGGGVASSYDDLDVQEFIFEEIKAAVDVAKTWNTYVAAHIFTDEAVQTAIKAGVKSIEHGNLVSDETLKMMKEHDVWLSAQPIFDDGDYAEFENAYSNEKFKRVTAGTDHVYRKAKEIGVKMAFGTDLAFDPAAPAKQGKMLTKLGNYFTPYETLKMATSTNAELLNLCGPRNPYRDGALGVIKEGAYADMVLVDGNPLEDLNLVADPEKNFVLIMKDGKVYKNTLDQ